MHAPFESVQYFNEMVNNVSVSNKIMAKFHIIQQHSKTSAHVLKRKTIMYIEEKILQIKKMGDV